MTPTANSQAVPECVTKPVERRFRRKNRSHRQRSTLPEASRENNGLRLKDAKIAIRFRNVGFHAAEAAKELGCAVVPQGFHRRNYNLKA